jgi:predicted nucleotidyltransferase
MELTAAAIEEMRRRHGVHTLILYGSHARGDATAESDLDLAGFADVTATYRDARRWRDVVLDAFVYPTAMTASVDPDFLKLRGGRVLLDERGLAAEMLARLDEVERGGPPALPETEIRMRRVWAHKMLARIRRGDVEAHYRHHWLLYQLLEDHHALRGQWFRGPKLALAELAAAEPATHAAFARALAPGAEPAALAALVEHVVGPDPG